MRKRVIKPPATEAAAAEAEWLDVEKLAQVEVTSEDPTHPIESALVPSEEGGWRAAQPGQQTIRVVFDQPQRLSRVWLLFIEPDTARTQEFVLRWSPDGRAFRDIVRQQWNFGPPETIREFVAAQGIEHFYDVGRGGICHQVLPENGHVRPGMVVVGTAYSYLQEYLPHVAQYVLRHGWTDLIGIGRMVLSYPTILADAIEQGKLSAKTICRTFSDCTPAPRNGLISGCYPLDPYYSAKPESRRLKELKRPLAG